MCKDSSGGGREFDLAQPRGLASRKKNSEVELAPRPRDAGRSFNRSSIESEPSAAAQQRHLASCITHETMPGEHRGTPLDGGKSTEDAARSEEGFYQVEGLGGASVVVH